MTQRRPTPAEAYQEYFAPALFEPLAAIVLDRATPEPGERALDVACGTGILTRPLADRVAPNGSVVGVDINPGMIEVAVALGWGDGPAIDYRVGDGTDLDLPDGAFDLVVCQQGLQFFPDRAAGVAEMHRVLDKRGRAVIAAWQGLDRLPLFAALADAEEPHLRQLGVEISREELVAPFSLGADELVSLLQAAAFDQVELTEASFEARFPDADHFVERMEFAYAAVVPQFAEDPGAFQAYLNEVAEATRDTVARYREGDFIITELHAHIAVAHA